MYANPESVTRVSSLGAGPIGGGWTAHFLARGYDVTAYLHDESERDAFLSIINTAWVSLIDLGLSPGASMDRLSIVTNLEEALEGLSLSKKVGQSALRSSRRFTPR